jgi:acetyl esterase/lipase
MGEKEARAVEKSLSKASLARRLFIAGWFVMMAIAGLLFAQPRWRNLFKEITVHNDLPYLEQAGPSQMLDLYLPVGVKTPLPVVIFIHGGGWIGGDKKDTPSALLAKNGFASASINYRLASEAKYPAQLEDCLSAVEWVKAHAGEYHLDVNRIAVWGGSAGGHLTALVALSQPSAGIKVACDWCGPANLETIAEQAHGETKLPWSGPDSPLERLLGGPVADKRALAHAASPVNLVSSSVPPFLIMHGDKDDMVPIAQSAELVAALQKAGARVDYVVVPGAGHNLFNPVIFGQVLDFFDKNL